MIEFTNETKNKYVKILAYAPTGYHKTRAILTANNPLIINLEDRLLSISEKKIPYIDVKSVNDLENAKLFISQNMNKFDWLCVDSISEASRMFLTEAKPKFKNGMQAYMLMQEQVQDFVRWLKSLDKHVYITGKQAVYEANDGFNRTGVMMEGKNLSFWLTHEIPEIFNVLKKTENGIVKTAFMTQSDNNIDCNDLSGNLDAIEVFDLEAIKNKILKKEV